MTLQQPPVLPRYFDRPPDDLDKLLSDFFRSEVPDPWPVMKSPGRPTLRLAAAPAPDPVQPAPRRWTLFRSRFALAATVALCLMGTLLLPVFRIGEAPDSKVQTGDKKNVIKHHPPTPHFPR